MLKRKAYGHLEDWKKSRTVQGLLIGGARQVGKTTLVREFAREHYENVAEVNFHENKSAVETIGKAADSRDLFLRISALSRTEIVSSRLNFNGHPFFDFKIKVFKAVNLAGIIC